MDTKPFARISMALSRSHSRRKVAQSLALLSVGAAAGSPEAALADSTPVPSAQPLRSLTREAFREELEAAMGFEEAPNLGGVLIDSVTGDIQTVMPFLAEESASLAVARLLFDALTGGDPRTGEPAPTGLADSWVIGTDRITYTFHLNPNATWHDGQPVTAEDVQFSFDALADPATGSAYTGSFTAAVASWRVIDAHTFEVVAKEPVVTFLYDVNTFVVPKHLWEHVPREQWRSDPGATGADPSRVIGSGPFKFHEWRQGESVTLVRNDAYYDKVPYLDSYIMRVWPDQTAIVNALLNNELDIARLEPSDVAAVEAVPDLQVAIYPDRSFIYLEFNLDPTVTTRWQDRRVRQALMYALDRDAIVRDIDLGYGEVAQGTQPIISYAYAPDRITTKYPYDPEKAAALLTDAGWTDTDGDGIRDKDGQALAFELLYPSGSPTHDQLMAYVQDAWRAVGVDATPRSLEFPALIEATTTDPRFEIALYGFSWDATFIQDAMFGCDQYQVGFNDMKYCNPELDAIHDEAKQTFDEEARRELLIQASNIVNEELPVLILTFGESLLAYSTRLRNFVPGPWGIPIPYVWIEN
jgi:peptide/nickel transport system substrate-binding protein